MTYFKIGDTDYSMYVSELKVKSTANYSAQTNAAGDTVVDLINQKRTIEVGIIPLDNEAMKQLQTDISGFNVSISFLNPKTNSLAEDVNCIVDNSEADYYTIQEGNVMYNPFSLIFVEL